MKKVLIVVAVCLLATVAVAQDERPWFDMENCSFCKHLTETPGMLEALGWDHYKTANGMLTVSTIPEKWQTDYQACMVKMKAAGEKMKGGEKMAMCQMCEGMGGFYMEGATWEQIETKTGNIGITVTDKPETIEKIHAWVDRTTDELVKMEQAMKKEMKGHEGHGH